MRRLLYVSLLAVPVLLLGTISDVGATPGSDSRGATDLRATLLAENEVPAAPGSDFRGSAEVTINESHTQLCWKLDYTTSERVVAGHIHAGPPGTAGPIVFGFFNPPPATAPVKEGCRTDTSGVLDRIAANPEAFYVNIHTTAHPTGAGRGQLSGESEAEDDAGTD